MTVVGSWNTVSMSGRGSTLLVSDEIAPAGTKQAARCHAVSEAPVTAESYAGTMRVVPEGKVTLPEVPVKSEPPNSPVKSEVETVGTAVEQVPAVPQPPLLGLTGLHLALYAHRLVKEPS